VIRIKRIIKGLKWLVLILSLALALIIGYFAFPWLAIFIFGQLEPNPPRPEIAYGEFPLRLEYEINGQRMVVEDTLICEFDGFGWNEGVGKYRKWKQRLASGNETIILLKVDETKFIFYPPGSAQYYMGDGKDYVKYNDLFPDAIIQETDGEFTSTRTIAADELFEKYKIRLISWEPSTPIQNRFISSGGKADVKSEGKSSKKLSLSY